MEINGKNENWAQQLPKSKLSWATLVKSPLYLFSAIISLLINLPVMSSVWRERRELEQLNIKHMRDIGLDPIQVKHESKRSFFDIPAERRISEVTIKLHRLRIT